MSIKKFLFYSITIAGCIYSLFYLFAALAVYINPIYCKYLIIGGLAFPYLWAGMLLWCVFSTFLYKRKSVIFWLLLLCGFKSIGNVLAINKTEKFIAANKSNNTIRILSWNVQTFSDSQVYTDTPGNKRRDMLQFIKTIDADILCLQDFAAYKGELFHDNVLNIKDTANYPYYYYSKDFEHEYSYGIHSYGTILYSKYPIVHTNRIQISNRNTKEHLAYADLLIQKDTVRVFMAHLQSMFLNFKYEEANLEDSFHRDEMAYLSTHPSRLDKIFNYEKIHVKQAKLIKDELNKSPYPLIFAADINSVPSNYTYQLLKQNLQDAFLQKGLGLGQTYAFTRMPTIRIDVILLSKQFKVHQYYSPPLDASDHYPQITEISLIK